LKATFTQDFLSSVPNLQQYVQKLQQWRNRYDSVLDRKVRRQHLDSISHWLVEFQYHKFDEIDVPGQYLKHEDNSQSFVRIGHFQGKIDAYRAGGLLCRRLTIVGHDGSLHPFGIQNPASRSSRREERLVQFFRLLNGPLARHKESRQRNLSFYIPIAVPITPTLRLVENDASLVTLQDVYEDHCKSLKIDRDDPVISFVSKLRALAVERGGISDSDMEAARLEVYQEISTKILPDNLLKNYMSRTMSSASDLWHIRRQMTLHFAAFIFMTYVFPVGNRTPSRISFSRDSGVLYTTDLLTNFSSSRPEFGHNEPVPFRFTPNLQRFLTAIGTEGLLSASILAIARALTEGKDEMEHSSSVFVREELITWHHVYHRQPPEGAQREYTLQNVDALVKRAKLLSCKLEREKVPVGQVPANQSILELLSSATNPQKLAMMDPLLLPWM